MINIRNCSLKMNQFYLCYINAIKKNTVTKIQIELFSNYIISQHLDIKYKLFYLTISNITTLSG